MKKTFQLPSIKAAPNSKATLGLPIGPTYETVYFVVTAAAALDVTDIGRIDVLLNGTVRQTFKNLQRLMDLNAFYNREADTVTATRIEFGIHFNRRELMDLEARSAPGMGTQDLQTFDIEIDIPAGAPSDIAIVAHGKVNPVRQNVGMFIEVKEFPYSTSVSGDNEVSDLLRGPFYSAIHMFKSDVTKVQLRADSVEICNATKQILERQQKGAAPAARVPVTASATHLDFLLDGNLMDAMPTGGVQDLRLTMTLGTSGSVDIVTETFQTLK